MSGPHFRDYHLLLDEHADQIFAITEVLAERCRKLGQVTLHSIGEVGRLQRVVDDDRAFVEPAEMLRSLMEENRALAQRKRPAHEVCGAAEDVASTSVLENFIDEASAEPGSSRKQQALESNPPTKSAQQLPDPQNPQPATAILQGPRGPEPRS